MSQPKRLRGKHQAIEIDGLSRQYIYFVSPTKSITKRPVLLVLHGGGGTAGMMQKSSILFNRKAEASGAIIIYPQAINKSWNAGDVPTYRQKNHSDASDVTFMEHLMDLAIDKWNADPDRIYVTGPSRGGIMSFFLADTLNHRIAAIAPVMASLNETQFETYTFDRPVPVLAINGTEDPLIPYEGGAGRLGKKEVVGPDGLIVPVEKLMQRVAQENGCNTSYSIYDLPDKNRRDQSHAERLVFRNCPESAPTILIRVVGGGHTYPGGAQYLPKMWIGRVNRDFDAMEMIWNFLMDQ